LESVNRDSGVGKHPFVSGDEPGGSSLRQHISSSWATATSCTSQAPPNFSTAPSRSRAFRAAALNAGILHDTGRAAAEVLLERRGERPTALVAGNDLVARGPIRRLRSRGLRCPEDVSIVGFNDKPFAEDFWPPLTTLHMPLREIGGGAARLLRHGIESGE
jgi:LacI family transcriptional regulator